MDNKLTFEAHIENLCKKASYKLWALQRTRKLLTVIQAKTLASSFVNRQFNYCAIVWMFCSRKSKFRSENTHKRALRDVSVVKLPGTNTTKNGINSLKRCNVKAYNTKKYKTFKTLPGFKRRLKKHFIPCN